VQIPPSTSTHIHLRSKAAAASAAPTSQEDNDWLSAELRDGHTKIPNLEPQEGLEAAALPNFSQLFFVSWVRNCIYHIQ
jgi:hypothetical protein